MKYVLHHAIIIRKGAIFMKYVSLKNKNKILRNVFWFAIMTFVSLLTFTSCSPTFKNQTTDEGTGSSTPATESTTSCSKQIKVKAILEGPFNGTTMSTGLLDSNLIPTSQPYSVGPFYYDGSETTTSGVLSANFVVDWVLIDLRSGTAENTIVSRRAALLTKNGNVIDPSGSYSDSLCFDSKNVSAGNYYVVIKHRSHLGIMSSNTVALGSSPTLYDFTTALTQAYDLNLTSMQLKLVSGKYVMIAGDTYSDFQVSSSKDGFTDGGDVSAIIDNDRIFGVTGYAPSDLNFDGVVTNADVNLADVNNMSGYFEDYPETWCAGAEFKIKAFLEGPFNGTTMSTTLSTNNLVPTGQPYNTAPWNYAGTESMSRAMMKDNNIVDWVLVDLYKTGGVNPAPGDRQQRRAALVRSDGLIVDTDGKTIVCMPAGDTGTIVIRHRNHIAIASANTVTTGFRPTVYDFTTAVNKEFGSSQKLVNSKAVMVSGDESHDGFVDITDDSDIYNAATTYANTLGYYLEDISLDGYVIYADPPPQPAGSDGGILEANLPLFYFQSFTD